MVGDVNTLQAGNWGKGLLAGAGESCNCGQKHNAGSQERAGKKYKTCISNNFLMPLTD
jgi:hypothetical protein